MLCWLERSQLRVGKGKCTADRQIHYAMRIDLRCNLLQLFFRGFVEWECLELLRTISLRLINILQFLYELLNPIDGVQRGFLVHQHAARLPILALEAQPARCLLTTKDCQTVLAASN